MNPANSSGSEKAQVSLEFMFIFMLFLAALAIVAASFLQSSQSVFDSRLGLEAQNEISLAKSKLDTAFLEGSGFSTNLNLPQKIMGLDYTVSIADGFVLVEVNNQTYSATLLAKNITGSLSKGENRLQNINQEIVIS